MTASPHRRRFEPPPELLAYTKELARLEVAGNDGADRAFAALYRRWKAAERRHERRYPAGPPNRACRHAVITGIEVDNARGSRDNFRDGPVPGEYRRLFRLLDESVYVWTHTADEYSTLVSRVGPEVHTRSVWRTAASCLRMAYQLATALEHDLEVDYAWVYYFDPDKTWKEQEYLNDTDQYWRGGTTLSIPRIVEFSPILELLQRDERFFVAGQNLTSSVRHHWFCVHCTVGGGTRPMHPNHEIPAWALASVLPDIEAAIVQATRAVEGFLGKPGSRETPVKLERAKQRWRDTVPLEPDGVFAVSGTSYFDYYYELFAVRNIAAHSYGRLPIAFRRDLAVRAQAFAWEVLLAYFNKHRISEADATTALKFNRTLIAESTCNFGTPWTGATLRSR